MNTEKRQAGAEREFDSLVEELFKHAAPRPQPPPAVEREVRAAVCQEWDRAVSRRITRRRAGWLAIAASVLVAAGAATLLVRPQWLAPRAVASIDRVAGRVELPGVGSAVAGLELRAGQTLTTGAGGMVALGPSGGGSLRVAGESSITLLAADRIELNSGTVYFDSRAGADRGPAHLSIATPLALVSDVGTQFMTRLEAGLVAVSVREGLVAIDRDGDEWVATVGERVTLDAPGQVRREPIATYGPDWRWTERIAPAFQIQGRRMIDVLEWFARETGRELEFGSLDAQRKASKELHRSAAVELESLTELTVLLATADLEHRVIGGKIHITTLGAPAR